MDDLLAHYLIGDRERAALQDSEVLRVSAQAAVAQIGDGSVQLLARTDEALMVAAAVAVLRDAPTSVARAPIGRTGWEPAAAAVLIEVGDVDEGLRETLSSRYAGLNLLQVQVAPSRLAAVA